MDEEERYSKLEDYAIRRRVLVLECMELEYQLLTSQAELKFIDTEIMKLDYNYFTGGE